MAPKNTKPVLLRRSSRLALKEESKPKRRRLSSVEPSFTGVEPFSSHSRSLEVKFLDTRSLKLFSCELGQAPAYVAISHVWAEALFPVAQKHDIGNTIGYQMVLAALRETSPKINHFWVDTWCIDQADKDDKHRQMPLMGQIYRTADFVLVTLGHNLNHTQSDLDDILSKLTKAAEIVHSGEAWRVESLEYLNSAEVAEPLLRGFAFLRSLMQSSWPTRLWCFQEAALAKKVLWIGLDRVLLHIRDETLVIILNFAVSNSKLRLEFGPGFKHTAYLMLPLLTHRLGSTDPTRVMEAAYLRKSTIKEDVIYGLMGASGVTIEPDPTKSLEMLWREWWKKAIRLGHIRWLMLSWDSGYPNLNRGMEYARSGCVVPPFSSRARASRSSEVHNCRPYGSISVGEDCIKVPGYCVGTCSSFIHLDCAANSSDFPTCFRTMMCLGRGDLELTMRIVAATWVSNVSASKIQSISEILCSEYRSSSANIRNDWSVQDLYQGRGNEECDAIDELLQVCVFRLARVRDTELYLTTIESEMKKTNVIMYTSGPIAPGNFLALDLNADVNWKLKSGSRDFESRVLMIAQTAPEATTDGQTASSEPTPYLHRVGITLPVLFAKTAERATAHQAHTWDGSPLEDFILPLSTASCPGCRVQAKNAAEIRHWLGDLHEKGVEEIFRKDIQVEYQRRFGRGQVEFLPDVKDRAFIDEVLYRVENGGHSRKKPKVQTTTSSCPGTAENIRR